MVLGGRTTKSDLPYKSGNYKNPERSEAVSGA